MFYNTPNIDYISNVTTVFSSDYYKSAALIMKEQKDCFRSVIYNYNEEVIVDEELTKALEEGFNDNCFIDKLVALSTLYKGKFKTNKYGIKYIGPTEEVNDDDWQSMNEEGLCYMVNARILSYFIKRLNNNYNQSVEITYDRNCPLYIYTHSFLVFCRNSYSDTLVDDEIYYNVSILKVNSLQIINSVSITMPSILASCNVDEINYLNTFNIDLDEERIVKLSVYKIIDEIKYNQLIFGQYHGLQLLNNITLFINQFRDVNWLEKIGFFTVVDGNYGIIDNRGILIWNPKKFYNTFKELAILQKWELICGDEPLKSKLKLPNLLIESYNDNSSFFNKILSNDNEYYLCRLTFF